MKLDSTDKESIEQIVERLFTCTQSLVNHLHYVEQEFEILPKKNHYGVSINYIDLQERREEFVEELINTIIDWVYSDKKSQEIMSDLMEEGRSMFNAASKLRTLAFQKFRCSDSDSLILQGQFGELLLFNLLQYFFKAVPLLRKMPITTSVGHERFGAGAIHYKYENNKNCFLLGESKAYTSAYRFSKAFEDALTSIINTYNTLSKELNLYIYDDFIDSDLLHIAKGFKNSTLKNCEIQLVSIIIYNESKKLNKTSEEDIKEQIVEISTMINLMIFLQHS